MTFERRMIRAEQGTPNPLFDLLLTLEQLLRSVVVHHYKKSCEISTTCRCINPPFKRRDCESNMTLFPESESKVAISRAASSLRNCRKPLLFRIASPISSALRASPCARTIIDCGGGNQNDSVSIKRRIDTCFS